MGCGGAVGEGEACVAEGEVGGGERWFGELEGVELGRGWSVAWVEWG